MQMEPHHYARHASCLGELQIHLERLLRVWIDFFLTTWEHWLKLQVADGEL